MVKTFFLKRLEKALNYYLGLDPESEKRLRVLRNKTITIELLAINVTFQLNILEESVSITAGDELPSEIKIRGTPLNLLSLALTKDRKQRFFAEDVAIEGNAELGQQIIDLFDQIEIDWEEYLSRVIGDIPAHEIGRFAKSIMSWGKQAKESLLQNMVEYVHEEKPWFPPREALDDFFRDVDEVRMAMDRLEARIKGL